MKRLLIESCFSFPPLSLPVHFYCFKVVINTAPFWFLTCSLCFQTLINLLHLISHVTVAYGKNFRRNLASCVLQHLLCLEFNLTINCRIAILAFHKALVDQPRDPLVVAAFSLAVSNGGSLPEAAEIARTMSQPHETRFHEILEAVSMHSKNALMDEVIDLVASVKTVLHKMVDRDYVSQAMIKFPKAPRSDLVSPQHFRHRFSLNVQTVLKR